MSIATYLSAAQATSLRKALPGRYAVYTAECWASLVSLIRGAPVRVVVLNPLIHSEHDVHSAERLIQEYGSVPFIAYVPADPDAMHAVARLARAGLRDVIVRNVDDNPSRLTQMIETVTTSATARLLFDELTPRLSRLPAGARHAVMQLFDSPEEFHSAQDLAERSQLPLTRLYRTFRSAELACPKKFVVAARVLGGLRYLVDNQLCIDHVAMKTGYPSTRAFCRHVDRVFGVSPTIVRTFSEARAVLRLTSWLTQRPVRDRHTESRMASN